MPSHPPPISHWSGWCVIWRRSGPVTLGAWNFLEFDWSVPDPPPALVWLVWYLNQGRGAILSVPDVAQLAGFLAFRIPQHHGSQTAKFGELDRFPPPPPGVEAVPSRFVKHKQHRKEGNLDTERQKPTSRCSFVGMLTLM